MTKVLVIEDEETIRANLLDVLEVEGFDALEASNGQVGLQMAKEHLPDIILCDVMMPVMDGFEVVKALREHPSTATIPFVFLTARAAKIDFRHGMVLGANDYLTKPFTVAELLEAITSQLAKQAAIAEKYQLELKQLEERFNQLLCYDNATGLPNQFLLREQFNQFLEAADADDHRLSVLCIFLHHFERFSTTLEPSLYHQLLKLLVARLQHNTGSNDSVARLKDNQFVVISSDKADAEEIAQFTQGVLNHLMQPFDLGEQRMYLSASVGISCYPQDGIHIEALVKNAEIAAHASSRKANVYQFYSSELSAKNLEQLILESDLRTAWEEANFQVYYQPQISVQTGQIIGAEALIRCFHPNQGLLSPARFIPIAEETGLIVPVGEWVAKTACQQTKAWQAQGYPNFRIAVNLSSRQFNQPNLEQMLTRLLEETGIAPECLELEITESCVMEDLKSAIFTLTALRDKGIHVALDDFGTGYSSLSYLKKIPLNTLKIDRSFIQNIQDDPQNSEIVKNIIQMAHGLSLRVIAEGIETEAELNFLCRNECDEVQGYLFSRPIPTQDFGSFLKNWQGVSVIARF